MASLPAWWPGTHRTEAGLAFAARYRAGALARLLQVDRFELHRLWRRQFGSSPKHWLAAQRNVQAARLIEAGHAVQEIARRLYYRDAPHFARDFKRRHGITALQWRNQRQWQQHRARVEHESFGRVSRQVLAYGPEVKGAASAQPLS